MPYSPRHQDIGVTLTKYKKEKSALNSEAASHAYSSIIDELSCRGWFRLYPDSGPLEIRNFFYVLFADNEVNNGGFAQYFSNGYGRYAANTVKAFSEIGAPQKAALLATVMASFPDSKYPRSIEEYNDLGELKGAREFLNGDFDDKYYHSNEKIEELMVAYVKKHFSIFAP